MTPANRKTSGTWSIGGVLDIEDGGALKRDGVDVTDALDAWLLECAGATLAAPTAEAANARTVSVQLVDRLGNALAHRAGVVAYVSSDATGDAPGDGALTVALTAGTDGAILPGADASARASFVSEADGDLDIVLTDSADGAATCYLHVILPNGKTVSSAAIAFADDTP